MNITAIKYRRKGQQELTGFRIPSPTGERRNFALHVVAHEELDELVEALRFGFNGERRSAVTHVAVQVTTDSGDTWVIERGPGHRRVLCNGAERQIPQDADVWAEILDIDARSYQAQDGHIDLLRVLDLQAKGQHLEAHTKRYGTSVTPLRGVQQVHDQLASDIYRAFRVSEQVPLGQLLALANILEPIYWESRGAESMKAHAKAPIDNAGLAKAEDLAEKLQLEVKLLQEISREAHQLLDPASAPSALRDRLQWVAQRQYEIKGEFDKTHLPPKFHEVPWEQVLSILGRLHAFHHFWQATEQVWANGLAQLPKAMEHHQGIIQGFANHDRQILKELEACLSQLTQMAPPVSQERRDDDPAGTMGKLMDRFKNKPHPAAEVPVAPSRRVPLEGARTAVETALRKLSEVHNQLSQMKGAKDGAHSDLDTLRQKLQSDYGRIRQKWQDVCKQWGLPLNLSLKTALQCLLLSAELGKLNYEEAQITLKLATIREKANVLEPLIKQWRQLIGSAKTSPIDTLSFLITETRSACDILPKKVAQLDRMQHELAQCQSGLRYVQTLEQRRDDLRVAWAKTFIEEGYAVAGLSETDWPDVFSKVRAAALLQAQLEKSKDKLIDYQIFTQTLGLWPLSTFIWSASHGQPRDQLRLMDLIASAPQVGYGLLLIGEATMADMLVNLGIPKAIAINGRQSTNESTERRPSSASITQPKPTHEQEIGDKARAALAMLQGLGIKPGASANK